MSDPVFKIGDVVEYEGDDEYPRWDMNNDTGNTGTIHESMICRVDADSVSVYTPTGGTWEFPIRGHRNYDPGQWQYPGYLRKKGAGVSSSAKVSRTDPVPPNNDGRFDCYNCGKPNRSAGGGVYQVCNNAKCDWFGR